MPGIILGPGEPVIMKADKDPAFVQKDKIRVQTNEFHIYLHTLACRSMGVYTSLVI